ncbi:AAA family ATPase [Roseospira navarrensis]|uniref:AAA family ATPase n=1 Tax=Roseospira navarrensis TaxID=140058 RepID=A0A7X1ZFV4_9PROT|nr:AAA family ATPase [Roseospira navarrensis]MQX37563.1 AAA family ATPase [Roseospira navarrensis]
MSPQGLDTIQRIKRVTLRDFRGFKGDHTLDTDADLVLISGPNGHGKTSVLEALTLLLTGWHDPARSPAELIARDAAAAPQTRGEPPPEGPVRPQFRLSAEARDADQKERTLTLAFPPSPNIPNGTAGATDATDGDAHETPATPAVAGPVPMPDGLPPSQLSGPDTEDRELPARLCAFFQDRLDLLFDQAATGRTFRDVFEPLPLEVTRVQDRLDSLRAELKDEEKAPRYRDAWSGKPVEELDGALADAWAGVANTLRFLSAFTKHDGPNAFPPVPARITDHTEMDAFATRVIDALGGRAARLDRDGLRHSFRQALESALSAWIAQAQKDAGTATARTTKLQAELAETRNRLAAIEQAFPTLDADIARFSATEDGLPNALDVFRVLARHARDWARPVDDHGLPEDQREKLSRVTEEFGLVNPDDAGKCGEALGTWLELRLDARAERDGLREQERALTRAIEGSLSSHRLKKLQWAQDRLRPGLTALANAWEARHAFTRHRENTEGRRRAREALKEVLAAVKTVDTDLKNLTAPDQNTMKELKQRADQVLWRFSLVEGVRPLHLIGQDKAPVADRTPRVYDIRTDDGRPLRDLSTGQRAQVGVSLLVAQNLAASMYLNHRVILLDDVTTAYGLSNLTREAILWRQFAYGADDDSPQKRQIFISSHHEDMTNHLLDLLVPPPGRSMRLIRFTGWSNTNGPEIETFQVEPSEDVPVEALKASLGAF